MTCVSASISSVQCSRIPILPSRRNRHRQHQREHPRGTSITSSRCDHARQLYGDDRAVMR